MATTDAVGRVGELPHAMWLLVRTSRDPMTIVPEARHVLQELDPTLAFGEVRPIVDLVADAVASSRFTTILLAAFALVAVALALVGVYGVVSYAVGLRARELGVRLALGSSAGGVTRLVIAQALAAAIPGAIGGALLAILGANVLQTLLFETTAHDPVVYLGALGMVIVAATAASWIPARRASRIDPAIALSVA
jgi:putative ABC transport system permease protein